MVAAPEREAMRDVVVRPMHPRHLRRVMSIERQLYPRPWSHSLFTEELARTDSRGYFVALASTDSRPWRQVVGYAGVLLQAGEAHVTTVAVDPAQHRRKIATHLVLSLLGWSRAKGAEVATLEVRAANRGAQRLYSAFGFAPVGARPGYYAETGEDAVIMWAYDLQGEEMEERLRAQEARLELPGGASGAPDDPVPWARGRVGLGGEE